MAITTIRFGFPYHPHIFEKGNSIHTIMHDNNHPYCHKEAGDDRRLSCRCIIRTHKMIAHSPQTWHEQQTLKFIYA